MGLDTTHDCWHGGYVSFHDWRKALARCVGLDLEKMQGFVRDGSGISWDSLPPDPLFKLLYHSDSSGQILVEDCVPIAERLEALVPALRNIDATTEVGGHLARNGGHAESALTFARGLRLAAERGENVEFH
jgi:hypothetical protein